MMALSRWSCWARACPSRRAFAGTLTLPSAVTWSRRWVTRPVLSPRASFFRKAGSAKSSPQSVEYLTPALVSDPFRFSIPTRPGHCPDQLPDGFGDDELRVRVDFAEDAHSLRLRADEAVFILGLVGVGADEFVSARLHRFGQFGFHRLLCGPAFLVVARSQVARRDHQHLVRFCLPELRFRGLSVCGHEFPPSLAQPG